jgi:phage shock protein A
MSFVLEFLAITAVCTVVLAAILFVMNRRAGGKIAFLGKSKLGRLGRRAEESDPVGQMRQAAEDAGEKIANAREALIRAEGAKSALERQVAADQREVNVLTARINRALDQGEDAGSPKVRELGEELARAQKYLAENQRQLADNIKLCTEATEVIKHENEKVMGLAREADRLEVRLDVSNAQAAVADVATHLNGPALAGATNSAAKFREIAERKIDENNARLRVVSALGGTRADGDAASADGEAALAEILAKRKSAA